MAIIIGTSGNDLLFTRNRGDILLGMAGDDTLVALHGFNILLGGYGDDQLTALSSFNILSGGAGNDYLQANRGWNVLSGGDGDDTLLSSADRNNLSGDAGNDTLVALAGNGNVLSGGQGDDRLSAFSGGNTLNGDAGDDVLYVDFGGGNVLNGGDGNDLFEAYSGANLLNGGAGNDTFYLVGSGNLANGGDGNDVLAAYSSGNALNGDAGNDALIVAGGSGNTLSGGEGDDSIQISGSGNTAKGDGGNDQLFVFDGAGNVLSGGDGMDFLSTQSDGNTLNGDAGNDSLVVSGSWSILNGGGDDDFFNSGFDVNNNILNGDAGNDFLQIWSGVGNVLNGGVGNDQLVSFGSNVLNGGAGNDTVLANDGSNILNGDEGDDTLAAAGSSVGNLLDGGDGDDQVQAFTDSNILNGGGGNDLLNVFGGAGNFVNGGDGFDLLIAFANNNILNGDAGNDVVAVNGGNGNILSGGEGDDNLGAISSIGSILNGDGGNDQLDVDGGSGNLFNGGDGDDLFRLFFSASNVFNGNTGNDSFVSIAFAGSTGNTVSGGEGDDSVQLSGSGNFANGDAGNDLLVVLDGSGNALNGGDGNDTLVDGFGDNSLFGEGGDDTIKGGAGDDILMGGEGFDTLSYEDSPTRVIVNMFNVSTITIDGITVDPGHAFDGFSPPPIFPNPAPTDTISDFEIVIGSAFDDYIQGSTNVSNRLEGGAGNDTLAGSGMSDGIDPPVDGAANDTLLGGAGNDVLRQSRGNDVIDGGEDFDTLVFVNTGIPYSGTTGVNVNLALGTSDADPGNGDTVNGAGGDVATITSIEQVNATAGNDVLTGGDPTHASDLLGNATAETFRPFGGNDTITGATGNGFVARVDYSTNTNLQPVSVNLGTGTASDGQGGIDTLVRVEQAFGGAGNDSLLGGSQERNDNGWFFEQFRGNSGFDTINGAGTDTVVGAAGRDAVQYGSSPAAVIVNLGATPFVVGIDTVPGGTARDGFGFTDTLLNIDQVSGSNFNDTLVGGADNQRLIGGAGNDSLVGGTSGVEASYQNSPVAVVANLNLAMVTVSDGFGGLDTLVNIDDLRGSDFNDTLTGNAADNRIDGRPGADTIDGGAGIDFAGYSFVPLANGGINAFIESGAGSFNDGFGSIDTLTNIEGLIGTNSNDTLAGGLGDQWFSGHGGSDSINGGADTDTVSYRDDPAGVIVNLGAGSATDGWGGVWALGGTDTLMNIENVEGSEFNDSLTGDALANRLEGQGGNDTIQGGAGQDTVTGGAGNDTIVMLVTSGDVDEAHGGSNTDTLALSGVVPDTGVVVVNLALPDQVVSIGGTLDNTLTQDGFENLDASGLGSSLNATGSAGPNNIVGSNGHDTISGGGGNDTLDGGGAADTGNDTLLGGAGDDELRATRGADSLDGGTGSDRLAFTNNAGNTTTGVIYGGATGVSVDLAEGTFDYDTSDGGNLPGALVSIENVTGTAGEDSFVSGDAAHAPDLLGNDVTETFRPLGGDDTITGAVGNGVGTRVDYSTNSTAQAVSVNLGAGTALDGMGGTDTLVRVEQVFGGAGDDLLLGGSQERSASGNFFEFFRGNAGNDTMDGAGTDSVVGAAGTNRVNYATSTAAVIVNLSATPFVVGSVTVQGGTARDGFGFTDTLLNIDQVQGSNHNDTLVGGADDHRLIGGAGNDSLVGGTSGVEASYQNATGAVNVSLAIAGPQAVGAGQGSDTLTNIDDLRGSDFNDTLTGNAADNRIAGNAGADTIDGGAGIDFAGYSFVPLANGGIDAFIENGAGLVNDGFGSNDTLSNIEGLIGTNSNDTLAGGLGDQWFSGRGGNDSIDGGAGNDGVSYIDDPAGVTVNLGMGSATDGWGGVWALGGTDNLISIENVEGSNFNDSLTGNDEDNLIDGGGGTDIMTGNAGSDTFDFNAASASSDILSLSDVITDFVHGIDKIDLSAIDADTGMVEDQAFTFVEPANANTVANSVTWSESGDGNTILQIDVNGNTFADMQIVLEGVDLGLTDADFIL